LLLATTAAALGAGFVAPQSWAAFPGANGKIVFSSNRDGNDEIYVMNPDGSDRVDLTRNPASDATPEWSPSGTQIAFASNRSGEYEIYVMNADGSGVTQLTSDGFNVRPVFTADGQYIVFTSNRDGNSEIYRMRLDGSEQTNLTNNPADDRLPASAPKGKMILFQSFRSGLARLYTMSESGGGAREIPGGPAQEVAGNWSPRGNTLTFLGNSAGFDTFDIYTAHTDGTGVVQLMNTPNRVEFDQMWSPDGQQIVFEGCTNLGTDTQHCALYTMNADGTGETDISTPRIPYLDTFSDTRIDPFWGVPFVQGTGPTIASANGQLEVAFPAATTNDSVLGYVSVGVSAQCHLTGDFDIQVDYRLLQWPPQSGVNVDFDTFDIMNGTYGDVHGMFVFDPGGGTGISTHFPGPLNTFVSDAATSGTLRFKRVGTTLTAYRLAGGGWSALQSTSDLGAEVAVNLNVFSNVGTFTHPDVNVAYDNFSVNSGTFACPSWWTDNAHDWQPLPGH